MAELFANPAVPGGDTPVALATLTSSIATAPAAGTTESWQVSQPAPSGLQSSGSDHFRLVVDNEIILVAASTNGASPWTVTRGAENTTPETHASNAGLYHVLTAGALAQLKSDAIAGSSGGSAGVASFNTRTGAVTLSKSDVTGTGLTYSDVGADAAGAASSAVATETTRATTAEGLKAPLASPGFTGIPTVPTATAGTNTTQAASTAFVTTAVIASTSGVSSFNTRTGAVTLSKSDVTGTGLAATDVGAATSASVTSAVATETTRATTAEGLLAPQASPTLTGTVTIPTPTQGDNSTKAASTAFVTTAVGASSASVTALSTITAASTLAASTLQPVNASGRAVSDAVVVAASGTVTSATAAFVSTDVGSTVTFLGCQPHTTITAVNSATSITVSPVSLISQGTVTLTIYGNVPQTLPASAPAGTVVKVHKSDLSPVPVPVLPSGSDDIDGAPQIQITAPRSTVSFKKGTGTSWILEEHYAPLTGTGTIRYNQSLNLYLPSDDALSNLKRAFMRSRFGGTPARYGTRGDSTTVGVTGAGGGGAAGQYNPGSISDARLITWPDKARTIMKSRGLNVGESFSAWATTDTRCTIGSGWSTSQGLQAASGTATGTTTFADDTVSNGWDLYILRTSNCPAVPLTVDGTSAPITLTQTNNTVGVYRLPATGLSTHTIVFSPPASGTYNIYAIEPTNTASPPLVKIQRFGVSGQTLATLNPSSTGSGTLMFPLLNQGFDAIQLWMGINDMHFNAAGSVATNVATYKSNLIAFVTAFQAVNCDVILTAWPSMGYAPGGVNGVAGAFEQVQYHEAIYQVADSYNCAVLDPMHRWGYGCAPTNYAAPTGATTATPMYDGTHPTLMGYWDHGLMLANFLGTFV